MVYGHHVSGSTGIGKTWLARALAQKACRDGYTALFVKAAELARQLAAARADGSHSKLLYQLGRLDLLVVDDFCMAPMTDAERRDFLEICDTRYQRVTFCVRRWTPPCGLSMMLVVARHLCSEGGTSKRCKVNISGNPSRKLRAADS